MADYTMTTDQTAQYNSGNDAQLDILRAQINEELFDAGEEYVEVYTVDGIVAWIFDNQ